MSEFPTRPVPDNFRDAHIDAAGFQAMYKRSMEDPEGFWGEMANSFLSWDQTWNTVVDYDFVKGEAAWFAGGKLNVCHNCIDRHLPERADQTALIWEGDDPSDSKHITYAELKAHVCQLANALKARGVKKGDRVCIYMPMIPEAAYAMLACARIGAIHSVVFGGFSPEALKDRILDSDCQTLITADEGVRGGRNIPLKANDIKVSVFFKENTEGLLRCSLRSKEDIDIGIIAREFGGGGHRTAAGFKCKDNLETVKKKVLKELGKYFNDEYENELTERKKKKKKDQSML